MSLFCELERIFSLLRVEIEVKRGVYSPKSTSLGKANRLNSSVCVCVCVCVCVRVCVCVCVRTLAHLMRGRGGLGTFAYVLLLGKKILLYSFQFLLERLRQD